MLKLFRPFIIALCLFSMFNFILSGLLYLSPGLKQDVNVKVDNLLPHKLAMLRQQDKTPIDILFAGTSQTNDGFSTYDFESAFPQTVNTFNFGLPGTGYGVIRAYLQLHIKAHGKPKLMLLEVNDLLAQKEEHHFYVPSLQYRTLIEDDPSLLGTLWNDPNMPMSIRRELVLSLTGAIYQYRPLLSPLRVQNKIISTIRETTARVFEGQIASASPDTSAGDMSGDTHFKVSVPEELKQKGWTPRGSSKMMLTPEGVKENAKLARDYYLGGPPAVHFEELSSLLEYCKDNQIPVVLVNWPNHPEYDKLFRKTPLYKPYVNGIKNIVTAHEVTLVDLSHTPLYGQTPLYSDTRHLNVKGAEAFSRVLAKMLWQLPEVQASLITSASVISHKADGN